MNAGLMINKLSNCLRRRSAQTQRNVGVSAAQGMVLDYILVESTRREVCQRDIEREFGFRPSTATEILQAMENTGLITRVPSKNDARRKNIIFTHQAEDLCIQLRNEIFSTEKLLLKDISLEEQEQFLSICGKMLRNLNEED